VVWQQNQNQSLSEVAFGGISPQTKLQAPPNWNMKQYKSVEVCQIVELEAPLLKTFWRWIWVKCWSTMWNPLSLITCKVNTDFFWCDLCEKIKPSKHFLKKVCLRKSTIRRMRKFTNAWTLFSFLVKFIFLVFIGALKSNTTKAANRLEIKINHILSCVSASQWFWKLYQNKHETKP